MHSRLVFLVPAFFGLTSVGAVSCFERVEHTLRRALRRRGIEARIVRCRTQPTASIPHRVDALRRQVLRRGGLAATELNLVGHSTGGLDVRMLLAPGVKISRGGSEERSARLTLTASRWPPVARGACRPSGRGRTLNAGRRAHGGPAAFGRQRHTRGLRGHLGRRGRGDRTRCRSRPRHLNQGAAATASHCWHDPRARMRGPSGSSD